MQKMMSRFYFLLWIRWSFRLTICSVVLASLFALIITSYIYINQGMPTINSDIFIALKSVFIFWFPILWSLTLLLALFRSLKYIFNSCIAGYELKLYSCNSQDILDDVGYGDLIKVWRKWFMLIIWLVGALMILSLVFTSLFTSYSGVFEWFDIYWLFGFILLSGYFSFIFMSARCKRVKIVKC